MKRVYYGEQSCEARYQKGDACRNQCYWEADGKLLCGVHSNRNKRRKKLPANPAKKEMEKQEALQRFKAILAASSKNRESKRKGDVCVGKLRMMKPPPHKLGYLTVFPNYRHGGRRDGHGAPELSPMSLGPVVHHQPGLPDALNIENYHQFNKVFPCEVDDNGDPKPEFYRRQREAYLDPVPHRHKFPAKELQRMAGKGGNKNAPLYTVHLTPEGEEKRYSYLECRVFYCRQYEKLALKTEAFRKLREMVDDGTNIQVVGYDGHPCAPTKEALLKAYRDPSQPFGHEMVLYSLLVLQPKDYPWCIVNTHSE